MNSWLNNLRNIFIFPKHIKSKKKKFSRHDITNFNVLTCYNKSTNKINITSILNLDKDIESVGMQLLYLVYRFEV